MYAMSKAFLTLSGNENQILYETVPELRDATNTDGAEK